MERAEFVNKVEAIGKAGCWEVVWPEEANSVNCAKLKRDGMRLSVRSGGWQNEGRIRISAVYPSTADGRRLYNLKPTSITVTQAKEGDEIAREIERRLIPKYSEQLEGAVAFVKDNDDINESRWKNIKAVADAAGVDIQKPPYGSEPSFYINSSGGEPIKPHGTDKIELTLRVSVEKAIQIINLLAV